MLKCILVLILVNTDIYWCHTPFALMGRSKRKGKKGDEEEGKEGKQKWARQSDIA